MKKRIRQPIENEIYLHLNFSPFWFVRRVFLVFKIPGNFVADADFGDLTVFAALR